MTHYRQIIINAAVKDDTNEEVLEEFRQDIETYINEQIKNMNEITEVEIKLN